MPVDGIPWTIVRARSASVGIWPEAVDRNLNRPLVRSRGGVLKCCAAMPRPSPVAPWQIAQLSRKTRSPSAGSADCPEALAASPRATATTAKAPGRSGKDLLENDELTRHMGRMQLALDGKDARLVRDEL